ncbi:MAG: PTS lactose/cellobiose transporter subunit IIA [Clostridium sp.]|uniref:PTS lactose/cellobiose transporter subunit IIA n=1 Tax=Clostridium sp. TaxID=1506 RepID=UPI003EE5A1F8
MEEVILNLIMHSGEARSCSMEGVEAAKEGNSKLAKYLLQKSDEEIGYAHLSQLTLMQYETSELECRISLLLVHAQDHLMASMTLRDLANELVDLYLKINLKV